MSGDVMYQGLSDLGAGLSGVGGIEGYRRKMIEELQAKAAMERLLKEAELKQQAEDNARAYQEAQLDAARREMMSAGLSQNELPTSGSSNADWIHAAINPAPAALRSGGSGNPMGVTAALMRLDPKAAASIYANERDNAFQYGVEDTPAFRQDVRESDSRISENAAQEFSAAMSGQHSAGLENRDQQLHPYALSAAEARAITSGVKATKAQEDYLRGHQPPQPGTVPSGVQAGPGATSDDVAALVKQRKARAEAESAEIKAAEDAEKAAERRLSPERKAYWDTRKSYVSKYLQLFAKGEHEQAQAVLAELQKIAPEAVRTVQEAKGRLFWKSPAVRELQFDPSEEEGPVDPESKAKKILGGR